MIRLSIALCLCLAACVGTADPLPRTYLCDGGRLAEVTYHPQTAFVRIASESFELNRVPSASGARYSGPRAVLHAKEDEALLTLDGRQLGPCQEVKPKA